MYSKSIRSETSVRLPSSDATEPTLLEVWNLHVEYFTKRGSVHAVDDVSFSIAPGEIVGLAGESGSGKSTTAHAIMRILHPPAAITGGDVLFRGKNVCDMSLTELERFRWRDVSLVFQSAMNALNPVMTVEDQIMDVIRVHTDLSKREARDRVVELLNTVGIESERRKAYPHQLSGGMRQRALIAIALALNPPLMILDEPTTALDVVIQKEILQEIEELKEKMGFSILFITHDLSLLIEFSDRIAIMYAGKIVELAPARELFENPLHPYTQGLMSSFPPLLGPKEQLTGIPGAPPDMHAPPSGCRFHPRCAHVQSQCQTVLPELREVIPGHYVACYLHGK